MASSTGRAATLAFLALALICLSSPGVRGDCSDCCSGIGTCSRAFHKQPGQCCGTLQGKPFCCPSESVCIQKGNSRFACKMRLKAGTGEQGHATTGPTPVTPEYRQDYCGFGCTVAWTVALCFFVPCCCCLAYFMFRRREESLDAATGVSVLAGRPWSPPRDYGRGDPRAPPNTPMDAQQPGAVAYPGAWTQVAAPGYPASGQPLRAGMWADPQHQQPQPFSGEPHKLSDVEQKQQRQYQSSNPEGQVYPPLRHSPPPREAPGSRATSSGFASEMTRDGGHTMAEPTREVEGAPGGPSISKTEPPPRYAPS